MGDEAGRAGGLIPASSMTAAMPVGQTSFQSSGRDTGSWSDSVM